MPQEVIKPGGVDIIMPLKSIAPFIGQQTKL